MSGAHLLLPEAQKFYDGLKGLPHITQLTPDEVRELWRRETPKLSLPDNIDKVMLLTCQETVSATLTSCPLAVSRRTRGELCCSKGYSVEPFAEKPTLEKQQPGASLGSTAAT